MPLPILWVVVIIAASFPMLLSAGQDPVKSWSQPKRAANGVRAVAAKSIKPAPVLIEWLPADIRLAIAKGAMGSNLRAVNTWLEKFKRYAATGLGRAEPSASAGGFEFPRSVPLALDRDFSASRPGWDMRVDLGVLVTRGHEGTMRANEDLLLLSADDSATESPDVINRDIDPVTMTPALQLGWKYKF